MFTTQKTRLERQLANLKSRLEKLDNEIKALPAYQDRQQRWNQELLKRERQREELQAQSEWVQVQLQRITHARQEALWFWIGFAATLAIFFSVLHFTFRLPIWVSVVAAYWATALLSQVQYIH